jgi:hypothetical protein
MSSSLYGLVAPVVSWCHTLNKSGVNPFFTIPTFFDISLFYYFIDNLSDSQKEMQFWYFVIPLFYFYFS